MHRLCRAGSSQRFRYRPAPSVGKCTRVLWNSNDLAVLTGRSMIGRSPLSRVVVMMFPRGRLNGINPRVWLPNPNPLTWTIATARLVRQPSTGCGTVDQGSNRSRADRAWAVPESDASTALADPGNLRFRDAVVAVPARSEASTAVRRGLGLLGGVEILMVFSARGRGATLHLGRRRTRPRRLRRRRRSTSTMADSPWPPMIRAMTE